MCGIAGLVSPRGAPEPELVERMLAAIVHRGPDEGGVDAYGPCVLGHRRLRVIDLERGFQPADNESGDVHAVFNGELYEFRTLREELQANGHELRGTGDTTTLPHLYEEHGPRFAERLHGMFALALWDAARERLVLARDRIGKKPLLWAQLPDGTLAFASELKALVRLPGLPREVEPAAIDAFLALQYVPGPGTALRGVNKLPPGHILVWERGAVSVTRYWEPQPQPAQRSEEEWLELVRETVTAAVRRRLIADVPLGALLSGGIDSSIVVALMAEASSEPVRTFTIGFPDKRYDERAYARAVAERYGTRHEELPVELDAQALLPRLAWAFDEPLGDEAALPTLLISELAREHVTVALGGDGGDESFAGYERYVAHELAERAGRVPLLSALGARALRALPAARTEPRALLFRASRFLEVAATPASARYGRLLEVFPQALRRRLLCTDAARAAHAYLGPPSRPGIAGLQLLDVASYLPGDLLLKADLASMAHSLELRSPLLDHEVLTLGISLPDSLKTKGRTGK
ncbi:MAG: asparagine synthase (glutamine-hydrolyzing), partial [Actinobacteria bacterium]|nr:asparagine synthase (glutamine-hydrolyzing) [Actinomycetota bacterium]